MPPNPRTTFRAFGASFDDQNREVIKWFQHKVDDEAVIPLLIPPSFEVPHQEFNSDAVEQHVSNQLPDWITEAQSDTLAVYMPQFLKQYEGERDPAAWLGLMTLILWVARDERHSPTRLVFILPVPGFEPFRQHLIGPGHPIHQSRPGMGGFRFLDLIRRSGKAGTGVALGPVLSSERSHATTRNKHTTLPVEQGLTFHWVSRPGKWDNHGHASMYGEVFRTQSKPNAPADAHVTSEILKIVGNEVREDRSGLGSRGMDRDELLDMLYEAQVDLLHHNYGFQQTLGRIFHEIILVADADALGILEDRLPIDPSKIHPSGISSVRSPQW